MCHAWDNRYFETNETKCAYILLESKEDGEKYLACITRN